MPGPDRSSYWDLDNCRWTEHVDSSTPEQSSTSQVPAQREAQDMERDHRPAQSDTTAS